MMNKFTIQGKTRKNGKMDTSLVTVGEETSSPIHQGKSRFFNLGSLT